MLKLLIIIFAEPKRKVICVYSQMEMFGENLEKVYKVVPKRMLPDEYMPDDYDGPSAGSLKSLVGELLESHISIVMIISTGCPLGVYKG